MKPLIVRMFVCLACMLVASGCLSRQTINVKENQKKYDAARVVSGNGDSYETAVLITGGKDYVDATVCEDGFIANAWGVKDKDWRLVEKTPVVENGRTYDMVQVEIPKVGEKHFYYFDITHYKKKQKSSHNAEESEPAETSAPKGTGQASHAPAAVQPEQKKESTTVPSKRDTVDAQPQPAAAPSATPDTTKAQPAK
jgi:hypothetical protein